MFAVFSRYAAVQVGTYAVDMGTFLLAISVFGWHPLAANVLAKSIAGTIAFIAHRRLTFGVHGQRGGRYQLVKYVLLLALNVPLSSGALALVLPWIGPDALAKFISDVLCMGITFLLARHFVFTSSQPNRKVA